MPKYCMPRAQPGGNSGSLVQHDFAGQPLFQHLTRNKPDLYGFPNPALIYNQKECTAHLAELRSLWNGVLWQNDTPSPEEQALIAELEGVVFTYERVGLDVRPLRLLQDGRIGRGLGRLEVGWQLFLDARGPLLVLSSLEGVPTAFLRRGKDGSWRGRWLQYERCEVVLTPEGATA